jgi:xanthine phosphoribosyltransferase
LKGEEQNLKELQERIRKDGIVVDDEILKVDSFINHQVDPALMEQIGEAFAAHFADQGVTKVATIESSGIAPALMTARSMNLPLIILKKQPSAVLNDHLYQTEVTSFTKETSYELTLSSKFISENDHVLIIDDFLANGEAATGAIRLIRKAHATVAGLGVLIEKSFQPGHDKLTAQGLDVYALARIKAMQNGEITFLD